jgi:hypothetical protein
MRGRHVEGGNVDGKDRRNVDSFEINAFFFCWNNRCENASGKE